MGYSGGAKLLASGGADGPPKPAREDARPTHCCSFLFSSQWAKSARIKCATKGQYVTEWRIAEGLAQRLEREGYSGISEIVGSAA